MELTFAAATDVGKHRNHNEDNFLIDKKLRLFIVADGMGGHAAGEVASSVAVHKVRDIIHENRDLVEAYRVDSSQVDSVQVLQILEHAIQAACSTLHERAQAESEKRGMGTTTSVLLIAGADDKLRGFIAHVGDSRIYLIRQAQCHQLTEDHSLLNELIKRGKVKKGQIHKSPYARFKNAVTRAVGVYPSVEVDTLDFDILPGDSFLLCSDGMYMYLEDEDVPGLMAQADMVKLPDRLIDLANEKGGSDNITAMVVRVSDTTRAPDADERAEELSLKLDVLKSMHLFRHLSYKELVRIMNVTHTEDCPAGSYLFREGERGSDMFIVLSGTIRLDKEDIPVVRMTRGQHFGEMALVDRAPRSLSAVAETDARLLAFRRADFYTVIRKDPMLATKLLWSFVQVLTERLRKTTTELGDARQAERTGDGSDAPDTVDEDADSSGPNLFRE